MPKPFKRQRVVRVILTVPADTAFSDEEALDLLLMRLRTRLPTGCTIEEPLFPSYSIANR